MTGTERIKDDVKKYAVAIIMMVFLCTLALAGRAQISSLEDSGQIVVENEDTDSAEEETAGNEESRPSEKLSEKVAPSE